MNNATSGVIARALNDEGIARFIQYLETVRVGSGDPPPRELLDDPRYCDDLSAAVQFEPRRFATRWGMAEYLAERLAALPPEDVENNVGLWGWLSLFYFDQVCPVQPSGIRKAGASYRHVPDFAFMFRYRHLMYGPFAVYRRHRGHAILLLSGMPHVENAIYHEITGRLDLLASRGVIEALTALYLDRSKGVAKRGANRSSAPGSVRRFARIMQQLDVTYDIYGMNGSAILELLPAEFDRWQHEAVRSSS